MKLSKQWWWVGVVVPITVTAIPLLPSSPGGGAPYARAYSAITVSILAGSALGSGLPASAVPRRNGGQHQ